MRDWHRYSIRDLVGTPISGSRPVGGVSEETEGVPSFGGENIRAEGGVVYENLKRISRDFFRYMLKGRLQPNDVLINKDGAQTGKVGIYDGRYSEAAVNEHLFILRSSTARIDQKLLYYYLLSPNTQKDVTRRITGSAQPGLNSQFVDVVHLFIPTEGEEQRRIAEILSTIDDAIAHTEALIAKTQAIKAGLMHDLFTRGVTPDGKLRPPREEAPHLYKQSPLGWIPKEWGFEYLSNLTTRIVDGVHHTPEYLESGVPFVTVSNLTKSRTIDFSVISYISKHSVLSNAA
jgi:type I restriction enzyme S subunit